MSRSNPIFKKFNNSIQFLTKGELDSLYFLMGDDQFLHKFFIDQLEIALNKIERVEKIILSVDDLGSKELINKINESDLFSSIKLIIFRNPNLLRGKARDELMDYCINPNSNNYLVFIQDEFSLKNKLIKFIASYSNTVSTSTPFENELRPWISYFFKENGYDSISSEIVDNLLSVFGDSVFSLKNEIDKLCLSLSSAQDLNSALINDSIHMGRSYKKFELFNYIGSRDVFHSIKLGRSLVSKDSSMLDLIRPLSELFQELLFIKIFKGTNRSQSSFSLLSPVIRKNIPKYANNFSSKEIVYAIKKLAKIDKQIKTSRINDKSAITEFIYSTTSNE
jgi:DNA polymerase III delta subunit